MPVGGKREGSGRKKGVPNKATASIREAAQQYTEQALQTLFNVMNTATEPAAARVSAANSILDRAFGKPVQAVQASGPDGGPIETKATIDTSGLTTEQLRVVASIMVKPG